VGHADANAPLAIGGTRPPGLRPLPLARPDEWAELPEWVEHHLKVGVGKMYILDDGSQASAHAGLGWCGRMRLWQCRVMPVLLYWCATGSLLLAGSGAYHHLATLGSCDKMPRPMLALQPPMSTVLAPYIASGAVEYHWFEGVPQPPQPFAAPSPAAAERVGAGAAAPVLPELLSGFNYSNGERFQLFAYDWCMQHHRNDHTWVGALSGMGAGG